MIDQVDRKLKRVKINLLRDDRFAFWRGIMMVGKTELVDGLPTAATDGYNEYYGREFVESLNEKMVAFCVIHENWHKIGRDLTVYRKLFDIDKQCANMAADYHHNLCIMDMDPMESTIEFPKKDGKRIGLLDERFRGMDVPTIFRMLREEKQSQTGAFAPGGDGAGGGDSMDEHRWEEANQGLTQEQQDQRAREVDQAMRQGEMEHRKINGDKAGNLARELTELLRPQINWKDVLADFVRSVCVGKDKSSWRRPNRRFMCMDVLMPSLVSERVGHIVVGVDTSGSISGREIARMLTEVVAVGKQVHPEKVDLLYWDSEVARHEEYDDTSLDSLATSTKPAGGGGTSPACVKRYMHDKHMQPECVIMLTDGYVGSWPEFDCPVLWVITTKGITAPSGLSIYLDMDQ